MSGRWRETIRFTAFAVGVLALPFALFYLGSFLAGAVPGWIVERVCVGFLCSVTVVVLGVLLVAPVLWVVSALYERGYLPEAW